MAPEYKLIIRSSAGVKQAEVSDFRQLAYSEQVNAPGVCTFDLRASHPAVQYLVDKAQIEVWWRDVSSGIAWYQDFDALFRDEENSAPDGVDQITAICPGVLSMLDWRINAYAAGVANKSSWTSLPAETVMKNQITNNFTSTATTANGRDSLGTFADRTITVQANASAGATIASWTNARKGVLGDLQDLAQIGAGDFDLIKTAAATWDFRFYPGQRGTNRQATVLFALERGNMANPVLKRSRAQSRTVAIVGGQGEGAARAIVVRTGPDFGTSNNIETFIDGRNQTATAALQAQGDAALQEARDTIDFSFDVLQTPATLYGKHYFVGDLVTARYRGVSFVLQVAGANVGLEASGQRTIKIDMRIRS